MISAHSFQTAAGLAALEGAGINPAALVIFKMQQRDDCVYDLSGSCFDDGTLEILPLPSEVQVLNWVPINAEKYFTPQEVMKNSLNKRHKHK